LAVGGDVGGSESSPGDSDVVSGVRDEVDDSDVALDAETVSE